MQGSTPEPQHPWPGPTIFIHYLPRVSSVPPRSGRPLAALALVLTLLGTCGTTSGLANLGTRTAPEIPAVEHPDAAVAAAATESARAVVDALWASPFRKALSAAGVVTSMLLLVAGGFLIARRSTAPWWIGQAAIANILVTLAEAAGQIIGIVGASDRLRPLLEQEIAVRRAMQGGEGSGLLEASHVLWLYVLLAIGYALLRIAIFAWLGFRARRPDVRQALEG